MIHVKKHAFSTALHKLGLDDDVMLNAEQILVMLQRNKKLSHLHVTIENRILLFIEDVELYVVESTEISGHSSVKLLRVIASADLLCAALRETCSFYRTVREPARANWIEQFIKSITAQLSKVKTHARS